MSTYTSYGSYLDNKLCCKAKCVGCTGSSSSGGQTGPTGPDASQNLQQVQQLEIRQAINQQSI